MNKQKSRTKVAPQSSPLAKLSLNTKKQHSKRKTVKTKSKRTAHTAAHKFTFTTSLNQSTNVTIPTTPTLSSPSTPSPHPAFKYIPTMTRLNTPSRTYPSLHSIQSRSFSSSNRPITPSFTKKASKPALPQHLQNVNPNFLPQSLKLQSLLTKQNPIQTTSKRKIATQIRKVLNTVMAGMGDVIKGLKDMTNPFRNKRGNTISLDGDVPWQYKLRNVLMVAAVGTAAVAGIYFILKSIVLALKLGFVYLFFRVLKKRLVEHAIRNGDLDRAIMFETWGESHANDNLLAKGLWLANPISWWRRVQNFISLDRRKQERCKEISQTVVKQLQLDNRMVPFFGPDYVIGEMDREPGEMGLEEEDMYDGFITIPIYSSAPTVIDLDSSTNNANKQTKGRYRVTGSDRPNRVVMEEFDKEMERELDRRMQLRFGNKKETHFAEGMELLDEMRRDYIDSIDPNEDADYNYKFYKHIPKWRWNTMDQEEKDALIQGKKEAFFSNRNIQNRIDILDFETLANRWSEIKWDLRQSQVPSRDGIMMSTSDRDLTEVGSVYAFFSVPALQNAVGEKNNRITIDAMNILTQGTNQPFVLEKVFVVGENVDRITLFHKEVAKWSTNPSLSNVDRTIETYRKQKRQSAQQGPEETVKSATKVVDFDMQSMKPVVEAETVTAEAVEAETVDYQPSTANKGKIVEAEILK